MQHSIIIRCIYRAINTMKRFIMYSKAYKLINFISQTLSVYFHHSRIILWIIGSKKQNTLYNKGINIIEAKLKPALAWGSQCMKRGLRNSFVLSPLINITNTKGKNVSLLYIVLWSGVTTYAFLRLNAGTLSNKLVLASIGMILFSIPMYIKGYEIMKNSKFINLFKRLMA